MDDARRVTGMTWASNSYSIMQPVVAYDQLTNGHRVEVRRINGPVGNLPQQLVGRQNAFTVTPSGAVVELPTRVRVPGRTLEVPATIIDPVSKNRLARMGGKALKMLPVVGTALQLSEFIDEIDVTRKPDGEYYPDLPQGSQVSSGYETTISINGQNYKYYDPASYCQAAKATIWDQSAVYQSYSVIQAAPNAQEWTCQYRRSNNDLISVTGVAWQSSCPAGSVVVNGQCQSQSQQPLNEQQLIDRINQLASLDGLIRFLNSLPFNDPNVIDVVAREIKDDPEDQYVKLINTGSNPSQSETIQVGEPVTTTTTNPDGSTVTTTTTTTATALGNQITFDTKTQIVTRDSAGNTTSTTTTTTTPTNPSNPNSPQQEIITCGLPDTPPCKIYETGTPSPPEDDGENTFKGLIPNCLKQDWRSCFPELPDINWSFSLPSGCGPIPVPFGKYGFSEVNICPWQGMIHDLMSMLWAAAGLFGAIGILSGRRNSEAS